MKYLGISGGYLARLIWACIVLYHSSTLLVPCQKLVKRSKQALTLFTWGLQNSSKWSQVVSKLRSSLGRPQDTYWSMPKSLLQATTFLHIWHSGSVASLHSSMFLHFSPHFRNLWYNPSFPIQSMQGPSMHGLYMVGGNCGGACGWIVRNETSISDLGQGLHFHQGD